MLIPTMTDGNPTGGTGRGTQNRDRHRAHVASDLDAGDAEASGHSHRAVVDEREELRHLHNSRNANWQLTVQLIS